MDEIRIFYERNWPVDPKKLIEEGEKVPLPYLIGWLKTYGCNNWRKMRGIPMKRGKLKL